MPAPTIYFIRHGETEWNALGRFQGWQDIPLNARGEDQARHAGGLLADLLHRDGRTVVDIGFVSSPLGRARATMERVRTALGLSAEGYTLDDRLREVGYGEWEGATLAQQQASHPEIFANRQADKWGVSPPGGESYAALTLRVRDWVDGLTRNTIAVGHGGTARALMVTRRVQSPEDAADTAIEQGAVYVFGANGMAVYL